MCNINVFHEFLNWLAPEHYLGSGKHYSVPFWMASGAIWSHLQLCGAIWCHLELSGIIWSHHGPPIGPSSIGCQQTVDASAHVSSSAIVAADSPDWLIGPRDNRVACQFLQSMVISIFGVPRNRMSRNNRVG